MSKFFEVTTTNNKSMLINIDCVERIIENEEDETAIIVTRDSGESVIKTTSDYGVVVSRITRWQ